MNKKTTKTRNTIMKLSCHLCGSTLSSLRTLKRHLQHIHYNNSQRYLCPYCIKSYTRTDIARRHIREKHAEEPQNLKLTSKRTEDMLPIEKPKWKKPHTITVKNRSRITDTNTTTYLSHHSKPKTPADFIVKGNPIARHETNNDFAEIETTGGILDNNIKPEDKFPSIDKTTKVFIQNKTVKEVFYRELRTHVKFNFYIKSQLLSSEKNFQRFCTTSLKGDFFDRNQIKPVLHQNPKPQPPMEQIEEYIPTLPPSEPGTPVKDEAQFYTTNMIPVYNPTPIYRLKNLYTTPNSTWKDMYIGNISSDSESDDDSIIVID